MMNEYFIELAYTPRLTGYASDINQIIIASRGHFAANNVGIAQVNGTTMHPTNPVKIWIRATSERSETIAARRLLFHIWRTLGRYLNIKVRVYNLETGDSVILELDELAYSALNDKMRNIGSLNQEGDDYHNFLALGDLGGVFLSRDDAVNAAEWREQRLYVLVSGDESDAPVTAHFEEIDLDDEDLDLVGDYYEVGFYVVSAYKDFKSIKQFDVKLH